MNFMIGPFFGQKLFSWKGQGTSPEHLEERLKFLNKHRSSCNFLRSLLPLYPRSFLLLLVWAVCTGAAFGIYNILGGSNLVHDVCTSQLFL